MQQQCVAQSLITVLSPTQSLCREKEPALHAAENTSAFGREPHDPLSLSETAGHLGSMFYEGLVPVSSRLCITLLCTERTHHVLHTFPIICMGQLTGLNIFTSVMIWLCTSIWIKPHITFTWKVSFPQLSNFHAFLKNIKFKMTTCCFPGWRKRHHSLTWIWDLFFFCSTKKSERRKLKISCHLGHCPLLWLREKMIAFSCKCHYFLVAQLPAQHYVKRSYYQPVSCWKWKRTIYTPSY